MGVDRYVIFVLLIIYEKVGWLYKETSIVTILPSDYRTGISFRHNECREN